jgi:hypothetical protein
MGIRPWREVQPDFPDAIIGHGMSTYYGGRSEVRLRRVVTQVFYCDFLSMYPTVCTLMNLWPFVIARRMHWRETTIETTALLNRITLADLKSPDAWRRLTTIVQIKPGDDILPVRAKYGEGSQATIGLNYLKSRMPLWFTLADCIASKLLTDKSVKILKAITFEPGKPQAGLDAVGIAGNDARKIHPVKDDFYRCLIDRRTIVKEMRDRADEPLKSELDAEQNTVKILTNSTSYGIFVELNVGEFEQPEILQCCGPGDAPFPISTKKVESPGRYFHPVLATLITGAARLILAIAERLTLDAGLNWAFCDTDSMAIAKPVAMGQDEFFTRAMTVCEWFTPLNPYEAKGPLFKIENANYRINSKELAPLFVLAISAKRYVLFNVGPDGLPQIRKASAHGLGHLLSPYRENEAPSSIPKPVVPLRDIGDGIKRWHHDVWFQIVRAMLEGHPNQVDYNFHPAVNLPALSRYAATTIGQLGWFKDHNSGRLYEDQVKPFNFLLSGQINPMAEAHADPEIVSDDAKPRRRRRASALRPISPHFNDSAAAAPHWFDRDTRKSIAPESLKTYRQALAQYHLSPESKFLNGEYLDAGETRRRHVEATEIHHIGKEADRLEEQYFLGINESAEIQYGANPNASIVNGGEFKSRVGQFVESAVAQRMGISRNTLRKMLEGPIGQLSPRGVQKMGII